MLTNSRISIAGLTKGLAHVLASLAFQPFSLGGRALGRVPPWRRFFEATRAAEVVQDECSCSPCSPRYCSPRSGAAVASPFSPTTPTTHFSHFPFLPFPPGTFPFPLVFPDLAPFPPFFLNLASTGYRHPSTPGTGWGKGRCVVPDTTRDVAHLASTSGTSTLAIVTNALYTRGLQ